MGLITEQTTQEELLKEYSDYPATLQGGLEEKPWYESRILPVFYEIPMYSKVLDVGCNDGTFMELLREKRKCDVYGIDVSKIALEQAHKKSLIAEFYDGEKIPHPDASFDVVCLMEVLNHVFDPVKLLSEIKRVLKPNGFLIGSAPHKNLESFIFEDPHTHHRYYDQIELDELLLKVFEKNHIKVLKGAQFALSMAQSFIATEPAELLFKAGGNSLQEWAYYLKDRSILRAWFGYTQTPGTVYYRISSFCDKMQYLGAETFYDPYDADDMNCSIRWQKAVSPNPSIPNRPLSPLVLEDLDCHIRDSDMSVWQITQFKGVLAFFRCIKDRWNKPIITEIDDYLFDLPSSNIASGPYHPNSDVEITAYQQIELSDYVICSTEYLKEMILSIFPEKRIFVIKNSIDFSIWDNVSHETLLKKEENTVRIGYTGCGNHSGDLEIVKKPILALLEEFPNVDFVLPMPFASWMDALPDPRIHVSSQWVNMKQFPQMVSSWGLDIGIAPLRDHHANRAKSNLRWLEYSAMKLPTVASDIYPFHHSITDQKDGILVKNSAQSWYEALKSLIVDKERRADIGLKAYEKVKQDYNLDEVSKSYLSVLKAIKDESIRAATRNRAAVG